MSRFMLPSIPCAILPSINRLKSVSQSGIRQYVYAKEISIMSNTLKITLIVSGIIIAAALLLAAGFLFGRLGWWASGIGPGWMMGWQSNTPAGQSGWIGPGMMGGYSQRGGTPRLGESWGHMGAGMMGGYWGGGQSQAELLSLDQAQEAVANFLADYGNEGFVKEDLVIEEIMIIY